MATTEPLVELLASLHPPVGVNDRDKRGGVKIAVGPKVEYVICTSGEMTCEVVTLRGVACFQGVEVTSEGGEGNDNSGRVLTVR